MWPAGVTRIRLASPSHPGLQSSPLPGRRAAAPTMLWLFSPHALSPQKITGQIMRLIRNTRRSQRGREEVGGGGVPILRVVNRYGGGRKLGQRRSAGLGGSRGARDVSGSPADAHVRIGRPSCCRAPARISMCLGTPAHGGRQARCQRGGRSASLAVYLPLAVRKWVTAMCESVLRDHS